MRLSGAVTRTGNSAPISGGLVERSLRVAMILTSVGRLVLLRLMCQKATTIPGVYAFA
jgi:hypothetical protein